MQRVQNVKNNMFLIFINLIFVIKLNGQQVLEGRYSNLAPLQEHYNFYTFNKNGGFEYQTGASLGNDYYGRGEYIIIDNKLILNYNKTKSLKIGHHISEIWQSNKDSIDVDFNLFDFDNYPIFNVNIIYKDSLSKNGYSGVITNEKGTAKVILNKEKMQLEFEITNLGFRPYKLIIDKSYNYKISVYLQKSHTGIPILNQTDTLNIVKMRRKFFVVKNKNGSETVWRKIED